MESGVVSWDLQKTYGFAYFIKTEPWGAGILRLCEFDNTTGKIIRQIVDYNGDKLSNAQVMKDGKFLIGASEYNIYKFNLENGNTSKLFKTDQMMYGFSYSPLNNKMLALIGDSILRLNILDVNTGEILKSFNSKYMDCKVKKFISSPSCKYVGITTYNTNEKYMTSISCILVDTDEMRIIDTLQVTTVEENQLDNVAIKQFAFSDDETKYAVLDSAYNLKVYSLPDRKLLREFTGNQIKKEVTGIGFDSIGDNALLFCLDFLNEKNYLTIMNIADGRKNTIVYSSDIEGKRIYGTNQYLGQSKIHLLNMAKADVEAPVSGLFNAIVKDNLLTISSEASIQTVEILSMDGKLLFQNVYSGEQIVSIPLHLSVGAYLVRVKIGDNYYSQKFIWGE
jgi:WD40 repeat protein